MPLDEPTICPVLIGRGRELAVLRSLLEAIKAGQGRVALISGEAGIGKSRLLAEVKTAAQAQGFQLLQGNCFQADTSYPYAPLLDLLRAFFASWPPTTLALDQEALLLELVQLLPDLALLFPAWRPLPLPSGLEPEQQKRRLFAVLAHFLTSQDARQAVLLVVEDIHWCDESSLEFLLYLARQAIRQPLLFLFTYRSEETSRCLGHWLAQLDRERLALELALLRLSRPEVAAMLQAIFGAPEAVPAELLSTIYTLTEGNPFFVEELLTALVATGELRYLDGKWEWGAELGQSSGLSLIPRSVQDAAKQRAERLSAEARQALTLAAVAGRRFDFTLLQQVLACDEDQLLLLIKELIASQFVVEESADLFTFRHALIRQAIYSELLARERRSLHRTLAEALEILSASTFSREVYLVDLAYHFAEAGVWTSALEYAQRAGERALALYAPRAAIEHLIHASDAAHQLHITPPGKVYYARGQAYETLGEFERARGDYERALEIASMASDGALEWQSLMALGLLWAGRDYAQAGRWFQRASELAERLDDPTLRAQSLNRLGNWLVNTGRAEESLQAHYEALRLFEERADTRGIAATRDLLGTAHGISGDRVQAVEQLGQAIVMFRRLGDTQSLVSSLGMRAVQSMPGASITTFCPLRTRDECIEDAEEAVGLARQVDWLAGQAFAENTLAHALLSFGEFGSALAHAQEAQRIATEIGHRQWMVSTSYALGHTYLLLLAPAPAIVALEAGLAGARELGSTFWLATLAGHLAQAYGVQGDLLAAQATLQMVMPHEQAPRTMAERQLVLAWGELALAEGEPELALQIAEQLLASVPGLQPERPTQPIPHLLKLKGEALLALARQEEAVAVLEEARQGAMARGERPVLWTIQRALGEAYHLLQREEQARQAYAAARQLIEELAGGIDDLSLRDHFAYAALASLPKVRPALAREVARQAFGGLTAREREVAILITQGKTSREIADLLVLSERTAEVHVSNILGKLGFSSRTQIAVWAVERGLTES